jgi:hypothetical protein
MSQRWIPIRTNSDSDFVITEVRKLNEVELSKKEKKRKLIEENRQKRIDKKLKEQEKVYKNLDNLDNYYKKVIYLRKRINLQTQYLYSVRGNKVFAEKIKKTIGFLNRKYSKPIRKKIPRNIIEQEMPYKYEVNSRKVLIELIKYVKESENIFNEWSQDVKDSIKESKEILKEINHDRPDEVGNPRSTDEE